MGDDRSVTFALDRLEISLRSVTAEMLNRQFARNSEVDDGSAYRNPTQTQTNPFTFGDWVPPEAERAPTRFTVFYLNVKNYAFPKVRVDPEKIVLTAANGRRYPALSLHALLEYYWPYAVAYAGNTYKSYEERRDLLRKSMFRDENIFSGQEYGGYVVFPALDYDVEDFEVMVHDAILRFDYRNEPTETVNIPYQFSREVYQAEGPAHRRVLLAPFPPSAPPARRSAGAGSLGRPCFWLFPVSSRPTRQPPPRRFSPMSPGPPASPSTTATAPPATSTLSKRWARGPSSSTTTTTA